MPIDRQRMRPWLEEQINGGKIQGLIWVNKEEKIFQIPWIHAARHGWELDKDAPLFMNWAIHTGKYHPGVDKPDPKTWKANFRCAMNSLPDIEEVKDKSMKSGCNAFRMYRMLSATERAAKKAKKKKMEREAKAKGPPQRRKTKNSELEKEKEKESRSKEDTLPDSTVLLTEPDQSPDLSSPSRTTVSYLPEVCAVVEITTENEESAVSSTQIPYNFQISPVSCYTDSGGGDDDDDDDITHSGDDTEPQDLSVRPSSSSVLRIAPSVLDTSRSFSSEKKNFWVTSLREDSPMIGYDVEPWRPFLPALTFNLGSGSSRASVIMKAVDLSSKKT